MNKKLSFFIIVAAMLDTYVGNVEQNDSRKIYRAKTPGRKVWEKPFRIFFSVLPWRLCAFARVTVFPILLTKILRKISNMFG